MKNLLKLNFLLAVLVALTLSSCGEDEAIENDQDVDQTVEEALNAEYSTEDPTESKKNIENSAIEIVNEIESLEQEEAIDVMMEMMSFMESDATPVLVEEGTIAAPLKAGSVIADESKSTAEVFGLLKAATEEGVAISDSFDAEKGVYEYDASIDDFVKAAESDDIIYKFPGKEGDQTNTAVITISGLQVQEITEPREGLDDATEVPTALNVTLTYKENTVMTYELTASYMEDGTPTSLKNQLTIGKFSFTQELTHTQYQNAAFKYSFTRGDKTIIAFGAEVDGNWTDDNIDNNTHEESDTHSWTEGYYDENGQYQEKVVTQTDTWTETDMEEIIQQSNAYIQFMNLKAVGKVNIKAIADGEQEFEKAHEDDKDENGDYPLNIEKERTDNLVELVDEYAKFVLTYADKNTLIASLKPYRDEETEYGYTDYFLDFKIVFNDDSPVSLQTFFENEFTSFFETLEDFVNTINKNYETDFVIDNPSDENNDSGVGVVDSNS